MYAWPGRFIFHEKKKKSVTSLFIPPAFMPMGIQFSPFRPSARMFVLSCVRHVRGINHMFFTDLRESFSSGVSLTNHSSESIHIWTIGTLKGRLSFHDSWLQGPCTSLFGIMSQYDPKFDLKINIGFWPIFHGPVILRYILKTFWCMNIILLDYVSEWHAVWPQSKCRPMWPIFHGPEILSNIPKTTSVFNAWVSYFQIMRQCDPNFDLKVNISQHDLHFMVYWFCLITSRLFAGWTS